VQANLRPADLAAIGITNQRGPPCCGIARAAAPFAMRWCVAGCARRRIGRREIGGKRQSRGGTEPVRATRARHPAFAGPTRQHTRSGRDWPVKSAIRTKVESSLARVGRILRVARDPSGAQPISVDKPTWTKPLARRTLRVPAVRRRCTTGANLREPLVSYSIAVMQKGRSHVAMLSWPTGPSPLSATSYIQTP
jgi:hypothetical protein